MIRKIHFYIHNYPGLIMFHFRVKICKTLAGRKTVAKSSKDNYAKHEYQSSFIQHEEYFISLNLDQMDDNKNVPVTEL